MKSSKNLTAIAGALFLGLATAQASASDRGIILDEAIDDYSDPVSAPEPRDVGRDSTAGYQIQVILDEAYFDYDSNDIAAYRESGGGSQLEQAEFAVFEPGASTRRPWELIPID